MNYIAFIFITVIFFLNTALLRSEDILRSIPEANQEEEENTATIEPIIKNLNTVTEKKTFATNKIDFKADTIEYDFKEDIVIATGNVEFLSPPQYIKANRIFYNAKNDLLYAEGDVYYKDAEGNIVQAEKIVIDNEFRNGIIEQLTIILKDKSTLSACKITKEDDDVYNIKDVGYTACQIIHGAMPTWEINASRAKYDTQKGTITLYNAWAEIYSIPFLWSPIISFSNLKLERKTGFLLPYYKNYTFGNTIITPFYIPIGDSQDIKIEYSLHNKSVSNPLYTLNYQGYAFKGDFKINTSFTEGNYIDADQGWHFFMKTRQDLTDTFRFSLNIEEAVYYDYLNMYDLELKPTEDSFLNNNVQLEGIYNYNQYTNLYFYDYRNVNLREDTYNQEASFFYKHLGENTKFGKINANFLISSFATQGNDNVRDKFLGKKVVNVQNTMPLDNVGRVSGNVNYSVYKSTNYLGNYAIDAILGGALYNLPNDAESRKVLTDSSSSYFALGSTVEYPFILDFNNSYFYTFVPLAQLVVARSLDSNNNKIYFDSAGTNITTKNLFNLTHHGGYDYLNDETSIKYGANALLMNMNNQGAKLFIGQIITFKKTNEEDASLSLLPYAIDSASNYFLSLDIYTLPGIEMKYETIIDNEVNPIETSIALTLYNDFIRFTTNYSYFNQLDPEVYNLTSIEELSTNFVVKVNKSMGLSVQTLQDLNNKSSLKELNIAMNLKNECLFVEVYVKRNYYDFLSATSSYGIRITIPSTGSFDLSF